MRNINAEYDEQSNDFQRSVNYDETQHNTTQHNIASIPYVLETDSTLEELAIKLGYSIDDLLALNPQYTAADKITANTTIHVPQPSTPQNTTNEHNTNYTSGSIVEIYQPTEEEKEEDAWWDWIGEVVSVLVEIAIEIAIEITPAKYVVAAYNIVKAISEGNPSAALSSAADLLPLGKHFKKAAKFIDSVEKAERLNHAAQNIEDTYALLKAIVEEDMGQIRTIVSNEIKEKAVKIPAKKINQYAKNRTDKKQGLPEKSTEITVYARADNFKDKYTIVENNGKLEIPTNKIRIPDDQPERELIENKVEPAPVLKPKEEKPKQEKPKQEKPKQEEQKKLRDTEASNTERLTAIDRDKDYLSAADKAIFDQVVNEKYSTTNPEQIKQRQDNIAKLETAIATGKKASKKRPAQAAIDDLKLDKLKSKLDSADPVTRDRFYNDFAQLDDAKKTTLCAIDNDEKLFEIWASSSDNVKISRTSLSYLQNAKKIKTTKTANHTPIETILKEHLKGIGKGGKKTTGGHLPSAEAEGRIQIKDANNVIVSVNNLPKNDKGVLSLPAGWQLEIAQYKNQPNGQPYNPPQFDKWCPKSISADGQTFFPTNMTENEVFEQCMSAFSNSQKNNWANKTGTSAWEAVAENGMIIRWWQDNDLPTSFFPKF